MMADFSSLGPVSMYGSHHLMSCHFCLRVQAGILRPFHGRGYGGPIAHRAPLGTCNGTCGDTALRCWRKRTRSCRRLCGLCSGVWPWRPGFLHPPVLPGLDRYIYICIIDIYDYICILYIIYTNSKIETTRTLLGLVCLT